MRIIFLESYNMTNFPNQELLQELVSQVDNLDYLSSKLDNKVVIRELDKRYTHANPKRGKCTIECCSNNATHWLTRTSTDYCQSDMVCNQHAMIWMQVKNLISQSPLV